MIIKISICDGNVDALHDIESQLYHIASELEGERELHVQLQIKTYCYEAVLVEEIQSGRYYPDMLLLDINLPKENGIDIAMKLRGSGYQGRIIFITHADGYYLEAFDVHAYHYILKDYNNNARFKQVLKNCIQDVIEDEMEYILLNRLGETRKILLESILYFEANRRLLKVYFREGGKEQSYEYYSSIGKMENLLLGQGFVRCHRSFLVSIRAIALLASNGGGLYQLELVNGEKIPLGASYVEGVKEMLNIRGKSIRKGQRMHLQTEKGD
ncbi:two-component system response regulator LytT [Lachnospiraceae bacterium PF1-21]|uniref:Stage 0 sporulation protein A homolog n=2 Tax=Ohessyouella blattaphilus TaxID=2949333 RepID=A0ABT1EL96_9FIRM|nr:LytTR family DNA-binding domain-containing protein [Ohessyouella blattaphilus]MCP1111472.1 LytTR family DNA-binding domain-containing protein [Ohessyouella blattaphilus]MCR8564866.1 LytTR family DNA-binding domain-containing protein [Ohessyouella blattaphilus]